MITSSTSPGWNIKKLIQIKDPWSRQITFSNFPPFVFLARWCKSICPAFTSGAMEDYCVLIVFRFRKFDCYFFQLPVWACSTLRYSGVMLAWILFRRPCSESCHEKAKGNNARWKPDVRQVLFYLYSFTCTIINILLFLKAKTSYGHAIELWKKRCGIDQKRLII